MSGLIPQTFEKWALDYARHAPNCQTEDQVMRGGVCTCGFIEARRKAMESLSPVIPAGSQKASSSDRREAE